jgi:hypothetical protein
MNKFRGFCCTLAPTNYVKQHGLVQSRKGFLNLSVQILRSCLPTPTSYLKFLSCRIRPTLSLFNCYRFGSDRMTVLYPFTPYIPIPEARGFTAFFGKDGVRGGSDGHNRSRTATFEVRASHRRGIMQLLIDDPGSKCYGNCRTPTGLYPFAGLSG